MKWVATSFGVNLHLFLYSVYSLSLYLSADVVQFGTGHIDIGGYRMSEASIAECSSVKMNFVGFGLPCESFLNVLTIRYGM